MKMGQGDDYIDEDKWRSMPGLSTNMINFEPLCH